jgi:hypothetical protein
MQYMIEYYVHPAVSQIINNILSNFLLLAKHYAEDLKPTSFGQLNSQQYIRAQMRYILFLPQIHSKMVRYVSLFSIPLFGNQICRDFK